MKPGMANEAREDEHGRGAGAPAANGKICPLPSPVSLTKPANRVTSAGLATLTSEFVSCAPACLRKPAVLSPSAGSRALTGSRFSKSLVHDD